MIEEEVAAYEARMVNALERDDLHPYSTAEMFRGFREMQRLRHAPSNAGYCGASTW
jgi:hypothetical protein